MKLNEPTHKLSYGAPPPPAAANSRLEAAQRRRPTTKPPLPPSPSPSSARAAPRLTTSTEGWIRMNPRGSLPARHRVIHNVPIWALAAPLNHDAAAVQIGGSRSL